MSNNDNNNNMLLLLIDLYANYTSFDYFGHILL